MKIHQREILFASTTGLIAIAAILSMPLLVAAPKLLFGRSLSAIAPSLFPYITLTFIVLLSALVIALSWYGARHSEILPEEADNSDSDNNNGWIKTGGFFILLTGYGLLLKPIGFFISSFLVISATSLMLGNKNWLQILLFATLAPICLYLLATRAMLVSLPEINQIELLYSHAITSISGALQQ